MRKYALIVFLSLFSLQTLPGCLLKNSVVQQNHGAQATIQEFEDKYGKDLLLAEQVLSERLPPLTRVSTAPAILNPDYSSHGRLPERYQPAARGIFAIKALLIPKEDVIAHGNVEINPEVKAIVSTVRNGKEYVRYFIHPNEMERFAPLISKYSLDETNQWMATPSSSARSMYIWDKENPRLKYVLKLSLDIKTTGSSRIIPETKIQRAVAVTKLMEESQDRTRGQLSLSKKIWRFMPEPFGALPKDTAFGGYLLRIWHAQTPSKEIILPWMSLVATQDGGDRWVDILHRKSGISSKLEFAWSELVQPLGELQALLSIEEGITPELHQQNAMVIIDAQSLRVEGIGLRDADGNWIDYVARVQKLGRPAFQIKTWEEDALNLYYEGAMTNHMMSYFRLLRADSVKRIFQNFLTRDETYELVHRVDALMVEKFNEQFPEHRIQKIGQLRAAWKKIHDEAMTPAQRDFFQKNHWKEPVLARAWCWWHENLEITDGTIDTLFACARAVQGALGLHPQSIPDEGED